MKYLVLTLLFLVSPAFAHDHWINQGKYRSPVTNVLCCGKEDCVEVDKDNISVTPGGILIKDINEVVPFKEVIPSEDGRYWRCHKFDGTRRCFFAPVGGS